MATAAVRYEPVDTSLPLRRAPPRTHLSLGYVLDYFGEETAVGLMRSARLLADGCLPDAVSKVAFWHMAVEHMRATNDEAGGCTEATIPRWTWATIFSTMNQMDTVADGLKKVAALTLVVPTGLRLTLSYGAAGTFVTLRNASAGPRTPRSERYIEGIAIALHCTLLWTTGTTFAPVTVRLSGDLDECDGSLLHGMSPKHTRGGHGTTLVYGRAQTDLPLGVRKYRAWCTHETTTFLELVAGLEQNSGGRGELVSNISELLGRRSLDQAQVARSLGVSVATLRRQLANEGASFRAIAGEARLRRMMALLGGDQSLDDIADDLGFADRRSLWRACVAGLGVSPAVYRSNRR